MLKFIVLGMLRENPMTGYELKQRIDHSVSHFWHAYQSQVYAMLQKLEQDTLLTSTLEEGDRTLNRRVYRLTEAGEQALQAWYAEHLESLPGVKDDLLVRVFFAEPRDRESLKDELRFQLYLRQQQLAHFNMLDHVNFPAHGDNDTHNVDFAEEVLQFGIQYQKLYIDWLESLLSRL
jgi:PadR family transcriptional regulator, regulatory protein AphA